VKVCFSVLTIFVAIFKNAVRIVTISYLTTYVDKSYYDSWVHRNGGAPFSLIAIAILAPVLWILHNLEQHAKPGSLRHPMNRFLH
jgi:exosortase/archaeosortase family protein